MSIYHHADCMNTETGLPSFPDKHFDLAIIDPPYGIGAGKMTMGSGRHKFKKGKEWDAYTPPRRVLEGVIQGFKESDNLGRKLFH